MPPPGGGLHVISPEDRQTLMEASKKADDDASVQAAKQKVLDAMKATRDLMVKKDPTLAPLLDKMEAAAAAPQAAGIHTRPSKEELDKLNAARASIRETPEMVNLQNSIMAYREARRNAMMAEPGVAAIFSKMRSTARPMAPLSTPPAAASATPASSPAASPK